MSHSSPSTSTSADTAPAPATATAAEMAAAAAGAELLIPSEEYSDTSGSSDSESSGSSTSCDSEGGDDECSKPGSSSMHERGWRQGISSWQSHAAIQSLEHDTEHVFCSVCSVVLQATETTVSAHCSTELHTVKLNGKLLRTHLPAYQMSGVLHSLAHGQPPCAEMYSGYLLQLPFSDAQPCDEASCWGMAECLAAVLQQDMQQAVQNARFISISLDECADGDTSGSHTNEDYDDYDIDSMQSRMAVHIHCVKDFQRVPMFLGMFKVPAGADGATIFKELLNTTLDRLGMTAEQLGHKLVSMGCNGCSVPVAQEESTLTGEESAVHTFMKQQVAPFVQPIDRCYGHRGQLIGQVLQDKLLIGNAAYIASKVTEHFWDRWGRSFQRQQELSRHLQQVGCKDRKVLREEPTTWISLHEHVEWLWASLPGLLQYCEANTAASDYQLYDLLTSADQLLGMAAVLPMLRVLKAFTVSCQQCVISPGFLKQAVTKLQKHLHYMYIDAATAFDSWDFPELHQLLTPGGPDSLLRIDEEGYVCISVKLDTAPVNKATTATAAGTPAQTVAGAAAGVATETSTEAAAKPASGAATVTATVLSTAADAVPDASAGAEQLHQVVARPECPPGQPRRGSLCCPGPVCMDAYEAAQTRVKSSCTAAAQQISDDMTARSPSQEALEACMLLTPEFWAQQPPPSSQQVIYKLAKLKTCWGVVKQSADRPTDQPLGAVTEGDSLQRVSAMIDVDLMQQQLASFQKAAQPIAMELLSGSDQGDAQQYRAWQQRVALKRVSRTSDPPEQLPTTITRLWTQVQRSAAESISTSISKSTPNSISRGAPNSISEGTSSSVSEGSPSSMSEGDTGNISAWLQAAEVAVALLLGPMEEEQVLKRLELIEREGHQRPEEHLEAAVRLFELDWRDVRAFPYDRALDLWEKQKGNAPKTWAGSQPARG